MIVAITPASPTVAATVIYTDYACICIWDSMSSAPRNYAADRRNTFPGVQKVAPIIQGNRDFHRVANCHGKIETKSISKLTGPMTKLTTCAKIARRESNLKKGPGPSGVGCVKASDVSCGPPLKTATKASTKNHSWYPYASLAEFIDELSIVAPSPLSPERSVSIVRRCPRIISKE